MGVHARHRAFTLVEILLATALASLIAAAVVAALMAVSSGVRANDAHLRARQAASSMLNYTLAKIRRAKLVHCEPASASDNVYSRIELLDDGVWNKDHYDSTRYTVIEVANGSVYVGSGSNANALTVYSGMSRVLTNVAAMSFRSEPQAGVNKAVTVDLTMSAADPFKGAQQTQFSLTGSAALRAMVD